MNLLILVQSELVKVPIVFLYTSVPVKQDQSKITGGTRIMTKT